MVPSMLLGSLAFILGNLLFQFARSLPPIEPVLLVVCAAILAAIVLRRATATLLAVLVVGYAWPCATATHYFSAVERLAEKPDVRLIKGKVVGMPTQHAETAQWQFVFREDAGYRHRLTADRAILTPHAQDRLTLEIRRRPPRQYDNPGAFDQSLWAMRNRWHAQGVVLAVVKQSRSHQAPWYADWRETLSNTLDNTALSASNIGMIRALLLGQNYGLDSTTIASFRHLGLAHLLVISGLHISLVSGMIFFLVIRLTRETVTPIFGINPTQLAAAAALLGAGVYSALAGFSVPAVRAVLMIAIFLGGYCRMRPTPMAHRFAFAWVLVLILYPMETLSLGFWLSFGVAGLLIYLFSGRIEPREKPFWLIQAYLSLAMIPISLAAFHHYSWISPVLNLFLIPLFGFVLVPIILLGALLVPISEPVAKLFWWLAGKLLEGILPVLQLFDDGNTWAWDSTPSPVALACGLLGVVLVLAPKGWPGRPLGLIAMLPLLNPTANAPDNGAVWLTSLDVGQGLSVFIQTANHAMFYDAGPDNPWGGHAGRQVLLPYLNHQQITAIDALVVSHSDDDHRGGAKDLVANYTIINVYASVPSETPEIVALPCEAGQAWTWDGVDFEFLHPRPHFSGTRNDGSCVLRVSAGHHHALLTGDIEREAEQALLTHQEKLPAEVLWVPHHGSASSSTKAFIKAVSPQLGIISAGRNNRYGFPRPNIVSRYEKQGVTLLNTAKSGAITLKLSPNGSPKVLQYRNRRRHYWDREE